MESGRQWICAMSDGVVPESPLESDPGDSVNSDCERADNRCEESNGCRNKAANGRKCRAKSRCGQRNPRDCWQQIWPDGDGCENSCVDLGADQRPGDCKQRAPCSLSGVCHDGVPKLSGIARCSISAISDCALTGSIRAIADYQATPLQNTSMNL